MGDRSCDRSGVSPVQAHADARVTVHEVALDEGTEKSLGDLRDSVKQIVRMGKEAIVAVIERRGEVIYYRVTKATFRK